jgi:alpha-1,2-glucosyltransferase
MRDRYLLSLLIPKNLAGRSLSEIFSCDTTSLRGVNALALTALANLALLSRWQIEARLHGARHPTKLKAPSRYAIHSAVNIALFPVIFFFSGLYYTDVASTAVVLGAFLNTLRRMGRDRSSLLSDMLTIFLGILALLMRQTNVFWVVVFLGGLEAIHAVKTLRPQQVDEPAINTVWGRIKFFSWRYSLGEVHDLPLHAAWEDGQCLPPPTKYLWIQTYS